MSAVVWVAVLSAAVLSIQFIRSVHRTYRQASVRLDQVMQDGLFEIDRDAWESEMRDV